MSRSADQYHLKADGTYCPEPRRFYWDNIGDAVCYSCGKVSPDHVRCVSKDGSGQRSMLCLICNRDHG